MRYLLDTNVLKELGKPKPHENVAAWFDSVDDADLAISAISLREIWKGIARMRQKDEARAATLEAAAGSITRAFEGRILPIDEVVAKKWGELLAESDKNIDDTGIAATAAVRGLIVVTRNERDFNSRRVDVLNPFKYSARRTKRP